MLGGGAPSTKFFRPALSLAAVLLRKAAICAVCITVAGASTGDYSGGIGPICVPTLSSRPSVTHHFGETGTQSHSPGLRPG